MDLAAAPILEAIEQFRGTIVDLDCSENAGRTVEPDQFAVLRKSVARALQQSGVESGDRVVMAVRNGPLFPAMLWALLHGGGTPLLAHSELPPLELRRTAERIGARHIITDRLFVEDFAETDLSVAELNLDRVRCTTVSVPEDRWLATSNYPDLPGVPLHPTSGTTGIPKLAVRPGACAVEEARHYTQTLAIEASDSILCVVPMSHAYGYGMCNMVSMLTSANLITTHRFNPKQVLRAMRELAPSIFPAVPAMLDLLCLGVRDLPETPPRHLLSAGAPLPEKTSIRFEERFGISPKPLYGTTETGGISVDIDPDGPKVTGCVGKPMKGVSFQLAPTEGGHEGLGKVQIKSSSMMAGYLSTSGIDTSPLRDGWLETGDLAELHDATILLKGRQTEVIDVFGLKVIPLEVEDVLNLIPEVVEVKVYAGKHRKGSQIVKAAVVCKQNIDESKIREHCQQHLAPFKQPERIHLLDELPRSPMGKILVAQLP